MRSSASARHISATPSWLDSEYSWIRPSTPLDRVLPRSRMTSARAADRMRSASFARHGRKLEERRDALGLGPPVGRRDRGAKRRLGDNLGAERSEGVGGHGKLLED